MANKFIILDNTAIQLNEIIAISLTDKIEIYTNKIDKPFCFKQSLKHLQELVSKGIEIGLATKKIKAHRERKAKREEFAREKRKEIIKIIDKEVGANYSRWVVMVDSDFLYCSYDYIEIVIHIKDIKKCLNRRKLNQNDNVAFLKSIEQFSDKEMVNRWVIERKMEMEMERQKAVERAFRKFW